MLSYLHMNQCGNFKIVWIAFVTRLVFFNPPIKLGHPFQIV